MADHFFGTFAGALRAFFVVLFIYGVVSIFSPILPSDWLRESYAMRGAAVVWPPVITFLSDRGWVDMNRLVSADLGVSFVQKTLVSSDVASRDVVSSDAPAKEGN